MQKLKYPANKHAELQTPNAPCKHKNKNTKYSLDLHLKYISMAIILFIYQMYSSLVESLTCKAWLSDKNLLSNPSVCFTFQKLQ